MLSLLTFYLRKKRKEIKEKYNRRVSVGDLVFDRWETAAFYGFGEGTSVYDSCLILGDVSVGERTWIGPNTILDGSGGGLRIGNNCAISAGVQIYTHDTVAWTTTVGDAAYFKAPTEIGDNVYIGPNAIIKAGVQIGNNSIVGALSYVDKDIPANHRAFGTPIKILPPKATNG